MTVRNKNFVADSIEARYAKRLAGNEKETRDEAFTELRNYIISKSRHKHGGFGRDEMMRIWKGLFYCLWMSDKPLVQEELAKNMAEILPALQNNNTSVLYFETFLATMEREWHGIDRLRMDKYYLLIRFMLNQTLVFLKQNSWDKKLMDWFETLLKNGPASPWSPNPSQSRGSPLGLRIHFVDIFLDELTEVGHSSLKPEQILQFLQPFCEIVCESKVGSLRGQVMSRIFQEIIDQSDAVLEALAEAGAELDTQHLNWDHASIASNLLKLRNETNVPKSNYSGVTTLIEKLKNVAGGHIPVNMIPNLGDEDLNDESELREAEENLVQRLCHKMEKDFSKRKRDKKHLRKHAKRWKRENATLPFQNKELQEDVDFDRIARMRVDDEDEDDTTTSFGEKMKQKRKKLAKLKKTGQNVNSEKQETKRIVDSAKLNVDEMTNDLIKMGTDNLKSKKRKVGLVKPLIQSEFVNSDAAGNNSLKAARASKKRALLERLESYLVEEPKVKKAKVVANSLGLDQIPTERATKNSSKRTERMKLNQILRNKLLEDEPKPKVSEKPITINIKPKSSKKKREVGKPIPKESAFVKNALDKMKVKSPKSCANHPKTVKSTPKRVSFELSKTQVQRFRKFDRSCVVSPSPNITPFDPNKTPDFGLLKPRTQVQKKKLPSKPKRLRASDFF